MAQAVLMTIFRTAELKDLNSVDYVEALAKQKISENQIAPMRKTKSKSNKKAAWLGKGYNITALIKIGSFTMFRNRISNFLP